MVGNGGFQEVCEIRLRSKAGQRAQNEELIVIEQSGFPWLRDSGKSGSAAAGGLCAERSSGGTTRWRVWWVALAKPRDDWRSPATIGEGRDKAACEARGFGATLGR